MPITNGDANTRYHLTLNKLVKGHEFIDPPGVMILAPDRISWLTPPDGGGNQIRYLDISSLYAPSTTAPFDESSPNLPLIFTFERCMLSDEFKEIHGERIAEDVRASVFSKEDNPFCVVGSVSRPNVFAGIPEIVVQWVSIVTVLSIRRYENGGGSWMDFEDSFKVFRRALCGICDYPVFLNGVIMGTVTQSSFLDPVRYENKDGDTQILHDGITLELTWEP